MATKKKQLDYRVLVVTHDDLDGAGCVLVAKRFFTNVDYISCHNGESHHVLFDMIEGERPHDYDYIFFTDICPTSSGGINLFCEEFPELAKNTYIIDHHATNIMFVDNMILELTDGNPKELTNPMLKNLYMKNMDDKGLLESGTSLFYQFIKEKFPVKVIMADEDLKKHVKLIRYWDTFMWQDTNKWESVHLNFVFQAMGFDEFILDRSRRFQENFTNLSCPYDFFDKYDQDIIAKKNREIQKDMDECIYARKNLVPVEGDSAERSINNIKYFRDMMIYDIKEYEEYHKHVFRDSIDVLVVGIKNYQNVSIISHFLFLQYPDVDMIEFLICSTLEISFRTRKYTGVRCDLLARANGGGGHKNASGCSLLQSLRTNNNMKFVDTDVKPV